MGQCTADTELACHGSRAVGNHEGLSVYFGDADVCDVGEWKPLAWSPYY